METYFTNRLIGLLFLLICGPNGYALYWHCCNLDDGVHCWLVSGACCSPPPSSGVCWHIDDPNGNNIETDCWAAIANNPNHDIPILSSTYNDNNIEIGVYEDEDSYYWYLTGINGTNEILSIKKGTKEIVFTATKEGDNIVIKNYTLGADGVISENLEGLDYNTYTIDLTKYFNGGSTNLFIAYPNPFTGNTTIKVENDSYNSDQLFTLNIVNTDGAIVYSAKISNYSSLNLSSDAFPGSQHVFYANLVLEGTNVETFTIVKE